MNGYFGPARVARFGLLSAVFGFGGLLGCRHRQAQPVLLPATVPVAVESAPASGATLVEAPKAKLPPVPVAQEDPGPKKSKKRSKPALIAGSSGLAPAANAPDKGTPAAAATTAGAKAPEAAAAGAAAETAAVAPQPAGSDVGVFTVGGEPNPHSRREAADLIASNDRRLNGLGVQTARNQAALVSKIRNFQRDAQQAFSSGDTEGAKTLATKGKLLLDDVERGVPSE